MSISLFLENIKIYYVLFWRFGGLPVLTIASTLYLCVSLQTLKLYVQKTLNVSNNEELLSSWQDYRQRGVTIKDFIAFI